jgi:hypothetical protein
MMRPPLTGRLPVIAQIRAMGNSFYLVKAVESRVCWAAIKSFFAVGWRK